MRRSSARLTFRIPNPKIMSLSFFRFAAAATVGLMFSSLCAAEPAIIQKARAYLGSEAALDGVKSVHFVGNLSGNNSADPVHPAKAGIEIIIQKPYQQIISITTDKTVETDGLNGYDAWHRHEDRADPSKWTQTVLRANFIHQMRANIWQRRRLLSFVRFRRASDRRSGVSIQVQGIACRKIGFTHDGGIVFYREFDEATGRLVLTESGTGNEIREEGELYSSGIKFPKTLITTTKDRSGKEVVITTQFYFGYGKRSVSGKRIRDPSGASSDRDLTSDKLSCEGSTQNPGPTGRSSRHFAKGRLSQRKSPIRCPQS